MSCVDYWRASLAVVWNFIDLIHHCPPSVLAPKPPAEVASAPKADTHRGLVGCTRSLAALVSCLVDHQLVAQDLLRLVSRFLTCHSCVLVIGLHHLIIRHQLAPNKLPLRGSSRSRGRSSSIPSSFSTGTA